MQEQFAIVSTCRGGGYMYARTAPVHPRANAKGLYPLHRVLMENALGRLLAMDEIVHHRDGNKDNNALENLEVMRRGAHSRHHMAGVRRVARVPCVCAGCGTQFDAAPSDYRQRKKQSRSGNLWCSRLCQLDSLRFSHLPGSKVSSTRRTQ